MYEPRELTPNFVADLVRKHAASGSPERIEVRDRRVPGLAIRIGPKGGSWLVSLKYVKPDGRQGKRAETVGHWPETTLADARRKAEDLRSKRNGGTLLVEPPKAPSLTLAEAYERWITAATNGDAFTRQIRPTTKDWADQLLNSPLANWQAKPLVWFYDQANLRDMSAAIAANRTPGVAAKCVELVRSVGNWTSDIYGQREGLPLAMPRGRRAKHTKPPARDTKFEPGELPSVYSAICQLEPARRDAWLFAFLTGQRASIVESLRWDDYDGEHRVITVEAERTGNKMAQRYRIPVSAAVASLLERRRAGNRVLVGDDAGYVFPTRWRGRVSHLELFSEDRLPVPERYKAQVAKAGVNWGGQKCHVHSARHTFAERAVRDLGVSEHDVKLLIGQKATSDVIGVYLGTDALSDRLREVIDRIDRHLLACMGLSPDHQFALDANRQTEQAA
ncbi:MAG: tyrosine-type recombinase/integrase [Hyphomonadaceae bacterium]|nr:tyrosine-type recombinase/integrase [Hyphomonadaceae bacterium]